jgi:GH25 family lysozyme M1 (1,4-beta-N-acetylmuramidase)
MNSNDGCFWTKGGHFIVARGCDETYIYANDPNKSECPRKQTKNKFQSCMKQAFIFWPIVKEIEPTPVEEETPITEPYHYIDPHETTKYRFDMNLEGKIIDISKWQGTIDFDTLKPEVGLVIARASCGSDKDVRIDEYAREMIEKRIPFGVYCYSYAGTVEKARDEAKKLIAYVEQYNPLFYIMDAEESRITTEAIKAFAQELRANTNKRIGCYVAHHKYKTYKYDTLRDLFDITWIPCYGKNDGTIEGSRKPSYDCDLWQYTSTGKISGIKGNIDMNITMKEDRDLKWLLIG